MAARIVVTGSSGYLGGALVSRLRAIGREVEGIDRRPSPNTDVVGDLATLPLEGLLDGAQTLVHLAALHAPHVGRVPDDAFVAANVLATARLLGEAVRAGIARFVFASSTSVYGHALEVPDRAVWVDETLEPEPRDIYDLTKLEAERVVVSSVGPTLQTVILRVGRCFVEPWRTTVVNRLHRGVDLRDVVEAFERSMTAPVVAPVTLNIAGPRIFDRSDLHRLRSAPSSVLADRAPGIVEEFRRRDWVLPATIDRVYVSDLASNVIGYRPRYDVWDALSSDPGADASGQPAARARVPR